MDLLAYLFVGKPLAILAVSLAWLFVFLFLRHSAPGRARRSRASLVAAIAWAGYAAWEWLVLVKTPEANIHVDLLVLWPLLGILSAWALYRLLKRT